MIYCIADNYTSTQAIKIKYMFFMRNVCLVKLCVWKQDPSSNWRCKILIVIYWFIYIKNWCWKILIKFTEAYTSTSTSAVDRGFEPRSGRSVIDICSRPLKSVNTWSRSPFSGIKISGRPVANASNFCVGRHKICIIVAQLAIAQFNWVRCRTIFVV